MPRVRLFKLGNSAVMTIPKTVMEALHLYVGDYLLLQIGKRRITLEPIEVHVIGPAPANSTDRNMNRAVTEDEE